MRNRQGKTLRDRLDEDIEFAKNEANAGKQEVLAIKALGAVDMAVEFGMITYKEWEAYIKHIFQMIRA